MSKASTIYVCQNCGASSSKWQGQCGSCGEWNTLVEELAPVSLGKGSGGKFGKLAAARPTLTEAQVAKLTTSLSQVEPAKVAKKRLLTTLLELDRVLGGGLVPGSVLLIGGEPGVGKSTLVTQLILGLLVADPEFGPVLYACGEESPTQIAIRVHRMLETDQLLKIADRQKLLQIVNQQILFVTSTDVDEICAIISAREPALVIIDSIQTVATQDLSGASGSIGQIREAADRIVKTVKPLGIPTFLIGHVTKEGSIAGPKVLEHMVDAVLELSGERTSQLRLLRALKNRFGATDEVGVFQLIEAGLQEVTNPSELFLEHQDTMVAGSATVAVMEGTRPLLVEVQALVVESQLAMPRRVGRGIELSRIQVLSAVLQKHARLPLGSTDVFVNAAGGFKITEPAVDLGLAVAIASSLKNKKLPQKAVFIGEIGLLGEIRAVSFLDKRIKEAQRMGFTQIYSRQSHSRVSEVLKSLGL
jgi:DNA repair protein RadA/Sms